jgi:hypothetical protein
MAEQSIGPQRGLGSHEPGLTAFGETKPMAQWSRERGIPRATLFRRMAEGWPAEAALTKPPGPTGRKRTR